MNLNLKKADLNFIKKSISKFEEIDKAIVFGSRAKGSSLQGSDVDIALCGDKVDFNTVAKLHYILEELTPMPYFFDIVDFTHLKHLNLKEHINRVGIVIYHKQINK